VTSDREQAIRWRAYAIWQQEGCPPDRSVDHWLRAEAEIAAEAPAGVLDNGKPVTASGTRRARPTSRSAPAQ